MRKLMTIIGAAAMLSMSFAPAQTGPAPKLEVGMLAPDFVAKDQNGKEVALKDFAGKSAVALCFYPKALTSGWTKECQSLSAERENLQAKGIAVVGVSTDPVEVQKQFETEKQLTIPLLADAEKKIVAAYQVGAPGGFGRRVTFLIDRYGFLRAIDTQVKVDTHGKDLLATASALPGEIAEGKPMPDFVLPDQNGKLVRLSDFKGKKTVALCFFPKAATRGWTLECLSLSAEREALEKKGVQILGISADTVQAQKEFETKASLTIPLLADTNRNVINMLGVGSAQFGGLANRWTFVLDKDGIIRIIDKQVKAASAGKDLVERINF